MQGEVVAFETEFPVDGIKIIFFVGEADIEFMTHYISHMVKLLEAAVIGNDSFGTAKGGSQGEAHSQGV